MGKLQYLYPFLFAIAPAIFLWEQNFAETTAREAIPAIAVLVVFGGLVFGFLLILYRNSRKAAILASVFLFFTLFFEQIFFNPFAVRFMKHSWAFSAVFVLVVVLGYVLKKTQKNLIVTTKFFAVVSGAFVFLSLLQLGTNFYVSLRTIDTLKQNKTSITEVNGKEITSFTPNIYYIIFDEYAAPGTIKNVLEYEKAEEIVGWLQENGFFVPQNSRSNYQTTKFSIPSSLNMRYLTEEESKDKNALTQLTLDHSLKDFLRTQGYQYVNFGAKWVNYYNPYADINVTYSYDYLSPLQTALWQITAFSKAGAALDKKFNIQTLPILDERLAHWNGVQSKFSELAEIPEMEGGPYFVFAHFMLPHVPNAFDAEGNYISRYKSAQLDEVQKYVGQVAFANSQIKKLVKKILGSSKISPIIIIQADHGWREFRNPEIVARFQLESEQAEALTFNIFNAYYLPNEGNKILYDSITPVNSFRAVLNYYFDQNLELLEDVSYVVDPSEGPRLLDS